MSHQPCDGREDTGAVCTFGWERRGHKPRSAHERLAHSVPYTEGAPGDIYIDGINKRAACGVLPFLLCLALCMAHLFVPDGS